LFSGVILLTPYWMLTLFQVKVRELLDEVEVVQTHRYGLEREIERLNKENDNLRRQLAGLRKGRTFI